MEVDQKGPGEVPADVLEAFGLSDGHVELLTGGRINRTLRVRAGRDLVLQQMHGSAHGDLLGIMENLVRVTSHLDWRRSIEGTGDSWYPLLVPTVTGKPFIMTPEGDVWRAFVYRQGRILRVAQPQATLASAGALYGRFAAETSDLGGPDLIETMPGFHNLDQAHSGLLEAFDTCSDQQRSTIAGDIATLQTLKSEVDARCSADGVNWSPDRVVHNDTKLTNVLFDRDHGRATAVLDLDLAMMGPAWHDVGDLFRSACWTAMPEGGSPHEPTFSAGLFDAVVGAFVESARDTLTDDEIATFATAGPRLSLELAVRYLHDHLRVEPHLQVVGENAHLIRGRLNMKLAQEMLGAYDALRQVVDVLITER